jgi:hypothetical protein
MGQYEYNTRSQAFKDRILEGGCHAVLVAKGISGKKVDDLEKQLITYLCWKGYPLVNVKDVPGKEKHILWTVFEKYKTKDAVRTYLGDEAVDLYDDWYIAMRALAPIITVLEKVIGSKWEGECADLAPKAKKPAATLTFNGETKTFNEWGKAVGVHGSTIKIRIEKLGWPIEKALSTPSIQAQQRKEREERTLSS